MIEVSHLTKLYGPRAAISDLNFKVGKGEIVGFLGPNGAGKSTTMKILTGFMPASDGHAKIAGYDVFDHPKEVKRNIGFLPENPPVYSEMTVSDYLEFAAEIHQVPKASVNRAVKEAIERTGLGDVRQRLIGNLSKGYRQRVGLAQALVHNPQVLILDEPTVGLDPKQIIDIRQLIKSLAGDHTVILSSHILPEVTATCQRIIVINRGKIVAEDSIEKLTARANRGSAYQLTVKKITPSGLEALQSVPGVARVSHSDSKVLIEIQAGGPDPREEIINRAVSNQMGVLEFFAEKLSLEEVFLQLTTVENTAPASWKEQSK
jgi:ABC-2 type transport system ATP-binding protein